MNWVNFKNLRKKDVIFLILFFVVCMHAMEEDDVGQPLLTRHDQEHDADQEFYKKYPELTAHILDFLPGNDSSLNYVMRFDGFQPATDPIESSPFYPIVETMREAHTWYIINACEKNRRQHSDDSTLYKARKALIIDEVVSFMKTTQYNKATTTFRWTDAQELNELVPKYTPQSDTCLNPEKIRTVLAYYRDQTQKKLNMIRYAYPHEEENIENAEEYLKFRIDLLYNIKKRAHNYPFIEDTGVLENATKCKWVGLGAIGLSAIFAGPINYVYFTHDESDGMPMEIPIISGIAFIGSLAYYGIVWIIVKTDPTCVTHVRKKDQLKKVILLFNKTLIEMQDIRLIAPDEQV